MLVLMFASSCRSGSGETYRSFDYRPAPDAPLFTFSASSATSRDPIRITVSGRKLSHDDRVHRVSLQKHWMSLHVLPWLEFVERGMYECDVEEIEGELPFCDMYSFRDPKTNEVSEFFIYIG